MVRLLASFHATRRGSVVADSSSDSEVDRRRRRDVIGCENMSCFPLDACASSFCPPAAREILSQDTGEGTANLHSRGSSHGVDLLPPAHPSLHPTATRSIPACLRPRPRTAQLLLLSPPPRAAAQERVVLVAARRSARQDQDQVGAHTNCPGRRLPGRIPAISHPETGEAHTDRAGPGRGCGFAGPSQEAREDTTERALDCSGHVDTAAEGSLAPLGQVQRDRHPVLLPCAWLQAVLFHLRCQVSGDNFCYT
jgi:hypothetical protein